jgi:hypothetical protein
MPEGLSAGEVGKEVAEHAKHSEHSTRHDRSVSIAEAVLLSLVTLAVAWSGYSAAKWSTESSVSLAGASAARSKANRANLDAMELRNFDASTFNAWFSAYAADDEELMQLAERRFRPEFRIAFDAWRATNPETNPNAPAGPTYMPQYRQPGLGLGLGLVLAVGSQLLARRLRVPAIVVLLPAGFTAGIATDTSTRRTCLEIPNSPSCPSPSVCSCSRPA